VSGSLFTVEEAKLLVPAVRDLADQIVVVRADLTVASRSTPGAPLADRKALEARLSELLDSLAGLGVQIKGWAPLLVDFPVALPGADGGLREVLLCWLEGDHELAWFHEVDHGFAGRRPLADLDR
jgi:hypothetical protein